MSQGSRKPSSRPKEKTASPPAGASESPKRIMATFYLSPEAVEKLNRVWLARKAKDWRATKSQIIEDLIVRTLKEERSPT